MKKNSGKLFILLVACGMLANGCAIFKKKCDCPPVGFSQPLSPDRKA